MGITYTDSETLATHAIQRLDPKFRGAGQKWQAFLHVVVPPGAEPQLGQFLVATKAATERELRRTQVRAYRLNKDVTEQETFAA